MKNGQRQTPAGLKGILYLAAFALLTAGATIIQIKLRGFEGPLSDYILIIILTTANFLLLSAVLFMTARSLWKLYVERRQGVLGARFRTKLVAAFVSLSFIPTILVFVIGSGMFTRSIERLFTLKIENSLRASVSLVQSYYEHMEAQTLNFGRQISRQIADERLIQRFTPPALKEYLARKASEYGLGAVELFVTPKERALVVMTDRFPGKTFKATPSDIVKRAFAGKEFAIVSDLKKKGEIVTAVLPIYSSTDGETVAAVAVSYYVQQSLAAKADEIRTAFSEYRMTLKGKDPIKRSFRLGFLTVTLALLLAAIWVALRVASSITVPIRKLAEGTARVAAGDLDYRVDEKSGDEVGMLVESFNRMTADLKGSRHRLEQEIAYKETILSNIDTGVVSLDRFGRIETINHAAAKILGIEPKDLLGRRYDDAFGFIELGPIRGLFRKLEDGGGRAEEVISVTVRGRTLTLRMRISTLKNSGGVMSVITFDDLTELLRAQKAETWQDVARKIAHEVKNPLTPIRLSAERMQRKFAEGAKDFNEVFEEASKTIVAEVEGLKRLLDEFSEFARMPRPSQVFQQIGPVVDEAAKLYAAGHREIEFRNSIPLDIPDVFIDREQMKRVFINLFQNAVEAVNGKGVIQVSAFLDKDGFLRIEVADNGPGIEPEDLPRLFDPYFSRKRKGGGLGLAIVERIIADHNGSIHAESNMPNGAKFVIRLPARR